MIITEQWNAGVYTIYMLMFFLLVSLHICSLSVYEGHFFSTQGHRLLPLYSLCGESRAAGTHLETSHNRLHGNYTMETNQLEHCSLISWPKWLENAPKGSCSEEVPQLLVETFTTWLFCLHALKSVCATEPDEAWRTSLGKFHRICCNPISEMEIF